MVSFIVYITECVVLIPKYTDFISLSENLRQVFIAVSDKYFKSSKNVLTKG